MQVFGLKSYEKVCVVTDSGIYMCMSSGAKGLVGSLIAIFLLIGYSLAERFAAEMVRVWLHAFRCITAGHDKIGRAHV